MQNQLNIQVIYAIINLEILKIVRHSEIGHEPVSMKTLYADEPVRLSQATSKSMHFKFWAFWDYLNHFLDLLYPGTGFSKPKFLVKYSFMHEISKLHLIFLKYPLKSVQPVPFFLFDEHSTTRTETIRIFIISSKNERHRIANLYNQWNRGDRTSHSTTSNRSKNLNTETRFS